ncbi:MAG TPA: HNH endonuclease [Abditibacteriaceae bacterium]|jgi:transcriptional regulator with XRE-family HTH domain
MQNTQLLGAKIRELRRRESNTQRDLAARVQIAVSYLDKIERGYCAPPSDAVISALAGALSADRDEFFALAGRVCPDINILLVRSPLLVQLVRLGAQWSDEQVRLVLRQNGVPESKLHYRGQNIKSDWEDRQDRREAITRDIKSAVFRMDNAECVYCSSQRLLQVDHIQPVCLGGTNDLDNLVTCCDRCNSKKGNRTSPPPLVFGRFRAAVEAQG